MNRNTHRCSWLPALSLAAGASLSPSTGAANPAVMWVDAGAGGALLPRSTEDVRIVSERLEFTEGTPAIKPKDRDRYWWLPWHVSADYVLDNLTEQRVELDVGFPIAGERGEYSPVVDPLGEEPEQDFRGDVRGTRPFAASFHVRLDGTELQHRRVENTCPAAPEDERTDTATFCYPYLFVFHVAIAARAQASLTVEYDQNASLCCNNESWNELEAWADYILETGALWAGTIGTLNIIYRFAVPPTNGVAIYDGLVGPEMPAALPYPPHDGMQYDGPQGPHHIYNPRAPEGVFDMWEPAVRFHYTIACRDDRIVLRLKATDVEPGGNISVGVQNVTARIDTLYSGNWRHAPCAVARTRDAGAEDPWSSWTRTIPRERAPDEKEELDAPPPEWRCSFEDHDPEMERSAAVGSDMIDYRYDCCCAAASGTVDWYPPVAGADAGAADGGDAEAATDAADADGVQDVVPEARAGEAAATVDATATTSSAEASGLQSGSEAGTAAASPPSSSTPVGGDASTVPAAPRPKSGCGCAAAGAGGFAWSCLAVFGGALLVRLRRRNRSD
jgi:hypothetical protein